MSKNAAVFTDPAQETVVAQPKTATKFKSIAVSSAKIRVFTLTQNPSPNAPNSVSA